jgi:riboflavin kinase/FMN adenylyltransferase|tara:strand:+ start:134 stop:1063 length:930 start_codon:yes stop_codon:yes gene_type:complete
VKVYRGLEQYQKVKNAVVTTGTFDGVHLGHRTIINQLKKIADNYNGETVVLTFHPHPRLVLQKNSNIKLLGTINERIKLLEEIGVDHLIILPFTKEFSRISSLEFVKDILFNKIGTKKLVIGYDHHFGRNREGSFEHLIEFGPLYGFDIEEIPAINIKDVNISSTKIREALETGNIKKAKEYLGRNYSLSGIVVTGNQLGRSIGFPTANIKIEESYKLIPEIGVYAVNIFHEKRNYQGMLNIGFRPTIGNQLEISIEVHIFDFNGNLYGQVITVEFVNKIRDERHFKDIEQLKKQLEIDFIECQNILRT